MTTMMEQIIDNIGYYGPVILFALGFYALLERKVFYTDEDLKWHTPPKGAFHSIHLSVTVALESLVRRLRASHYKSSSVYTAFVFGNISNSLLNMVLKNIIREPRPIEEEGDYGFPSGHAQSVFFSLVFLFLANGPPVFIYMMGCISVLTLYQRWKYKKHSVKQLVAGSIIGSLYAVFIIYLTDQYLLSKNYLVKESDVIQI
jgi:membrane-associated phospholipid phosphatase